MGARPLGVEDMLSSTLPASLLAREKAWEDLLKPPLVSCTQHVPIKACTQLAAERVALHAHRSTGSCRGFRAAIPTVPCRFCRTPPSAPQWNNRGTCGCRVYSIILTDAVMCWRHGVWLQTQAKRTCVTYAGWCGVSRPLAL